MKLETLFGVAGERAPPQMARNLAVELGPQNIRARSEARSATTWAMSMGSWR